MMKHKILVIDDEFLIRMSLESGLEDLGYQVRCVESAAEGLSAMEEIHPDVILLDNRLGSDTGLSHIAEFRALDEDIIIILMTAYGSIQNAVEAMKLGVSHYIQKPFDLEEIDLVESDCFPSLTEAQAALEHLQAQHCRSAWTIQCWIVGQADWQEGYLRD